jgi:hypothetical protein
MTMAREFSITDRRPDRRISIRADEERRGNETLAKRRLNAQAPAGIWLEADT